MTGVVSTLTTTTPPTPPTTKGHLGTTTVSPIRIATTTTPMGSATMDMEGRIELLVRRPRYVAPSTGLDPSDDDAVGYISSLLAEEAAGMFADDGGRNEEAAAARENLKQVVAQFLGGDEYLPQASELIDEVARLFVDEDDDERKKNDVVNGVGANGSVGDELDLTKPTRFDQALSLSSGHPTQPPSNSKIEDEANLGDCVDNLEKIPEDEEEEKPTTTKKKSKAGKHNTSKAKRKGKDRHKRNHGSGGSSDEDRETNAEGEAAERVKARSALELEDLDDSSSAWAECRAEGRAWGGRGAGGRGLRNQHTTSTAVRSVHLSNVSLQFGGNDLLQGATIQLSEGRRYGLIGRNGVGKSTLLRRLANKMIPGFPMHMRVLLVHQQVDGSDKSSLQTLLDADEGRGALLAEQARLEDRLDSLADGGEAAEGEASGEGDDIATVAEALNEVMEELDAIDADTAEERARSILRGLQFTEEMQDSPTNHLSGGWRMRLALAQSLFVPTDLLLLDEPTNHLDLHAVLWLGEHLVKSGRTIVVVSHDRAFLDDVCTDVINFEHQRLKYHPGNFSAFEQQRSEKAARESHILDAAERKREKAVQFIEKQQRQLSHGGKRGHDPNKQRQAKMMRDKKLDRIGTYREDGKKFKNFSLKTLSEDSFRMGQKVVVEADEPALRFKLPDPSWSPGMKGDAALISLEDVSFDYDPSSTKKKKKVKNPAVPGSPLLLNGMTLNVHPGSKIALVGRNGAGKSTLLKVMLGNVDATTGTVWRHPTLRVGHVTQHSVEELDPYAEMTVVEYMRGRLSAATDGEGEAGEQQRFAGTTSATRTYLGAFGLGGNRHANRLIGSLSGGERMRLCFATVFASRPHMLFLDEPSNHLDMETLDALSTALEAYKGAVVIISHNQRFLCGFCNELWVVEDGHVDVKHSDTSSFEENFAKYRSVAVQGIQSRSSSRQARAVMAKQATRQRTGAAQSTGFVG